jgi:phospholipid/cholesterol/gamma-HCH transport system substrate-binding protein
MKRAIKKYRKDFLAMVGVMILSIGVLGYIVAEQKARPQIPLIEGSPFRIQIELADARAVVPGQGQEIKVAGVQIGRVQGIELQEGKAIVDADLDPKYKGLVRRDATALLRPKTGLKDMFVEIDPGSKSQPPLHAMDRIPVANTAPDVDPDEVLEALDSDTRAYLQLLLNGAGKGLQNHGNDLREVFRRLAPLHRDLARVTTAVAERRQNLRTLVHNYGSLMTRLGRSDNDLRRIVTASNRTLGAFADENQNVSATVRELAPTLNVTSNTLQKVGRLGRVLGPAAEALRPPFRQLDNTNAELRPLAREGTPIIRDEVRPFVRRARPYVRSLRPAAEDLSHSAPDLQKSLLETNRLFNMAAYNPNGSSPMSPSRPGSYLFWLAWEANNGVSLFSTSDASGPFRRAGAFFSCSTLATLASSPPSGQGPLGALVPTLFGFGPIAQTCPGGTASSSNGKKQTKPQAAQDTSNPNARGAAQNAQQPKNGSVANRPSGPAGRDARGGGAR